MRVLVLALTLTACSVTPPAPDPYECVRDALGYGCDTLAPPVMDSLLPLPDSVP